MIFSVSLLTCLVVSVSARNLLETQEILSSVKTDGALILPAAELELRSTEGGLPEALLPLANASLLAEQKKDNGTSTDLTKEEAEHARHDHSHMASVASTAEHPKPVLSPMATAAAARREAAKLAAAERREAALKKQQELLAKLEEAKKSHASAGIHVTSSAEAGDKLAVAENNGTLNGSASAEPLAAHAAAVGASPHRHLKPGAVAPHSAAAAAGKKPVRHNLKPGAIAPKAPVHIAAAANGKHHNLKPGAKAPVAAQRAEDLPVSAAVSDQAQHEVPAIEGKALMDKEAVNHSSHLIPENVTDASAHVAHDDAKTVHDESFSKVHQADAEHHAAVKESHNETMEHHDILEHHEEKNASLPAVDDHHVTNSSNNETLGHQKSKVNWHQVMKTADEHDQKIAAELAAAASTTTTVPVMTSTVSAQSDLQNQNKPVVSELKNIKDVNA